ncbi:ATP-binding protein [Caulobacter sp. LjRoot300]|uniref:ATP-binding protein n=1 Tax=Caulobacter sp. LjRoot300 TaxID=3342321 RepID=UPI003ECD8AA0
MDLVAWQEQNGRYLAASLVWLRARLQLLADSAEPAEPPRRTGMLPLRKSAVARENVRLSDVSSTRDKAAEMDPPPALQLLADQLRLTPFERDVVLLCVAMELDTRVPGLCAQALGDPGQPYPTFGLAMALFDDPSWDAMSPQRPLRYWQVVEPGVGPTQPLSSAPLRADERIVHYAKGLNVLDPRLAVLGSGFDGDDAPLPPSQQEQAERIVERWGGAELSAPAPVATLIGPDGEAKRLVAQAVATTLDRKLHVIAAEGLPTTASELDRLARIWQREAALLPIALYVDAEGAGYAAERDASVSRFIAQAARSDGFVFLGTREPWAPAGFEALLVPCSRPTAEEQDEAWREVLSSLAEADRDAAAARLAGQYSLNLSEIRAVARLTPADPPETLADRLWARCRERVRPRLGSLADRIDPRARWEDLVVAKETDQLLRAMVDQVAARGQVYSRWGFSQRMNRGLGVSALFAGDSGTGKTMAAEVIANALGLALYRIDLSQVVSKYIGETEKNLQRVFDLMEGGGAILFFDEADALFGKRSEVRDSHDRYANIEVNYLLQRMETYTGVAILATNIQSALDPAFVRRLRFIVPFSFPGPPERQALWERVFPAATPVEGLDVERLSRLSLTGAGIHNVALQAAFLAASGGGTVTMPLILRAARTEFRKMDRPLNEAEFRV